MSNDIIKGEYLPTIEIEVPMPAVKPPRKRNPITEMYFPDKISLDEFALEIVMSLRPFMISMYHINFLGPKYPEEWVSLYLHWCEMYNKEKKDEQGD